MSMDASTLSASAGLVGAVGKAAGSLQSGQDRAAEADSRQKMALYQQQVALNNQIIANQNATYEENVGISQTEIQQMKDRAKDSAIKVGQAASGVDVNRGSAVNVQASAKKIEQTDEQTVMQRALTRAYGYRALASNYGSDAGRFGVQASFAPAEADSYRRAGFMGAAGDLLSGFQYLPKFGGEKTTKKDASPEQKNAIYGGEYGGNEYSV